MDGHGASGDRRHFAVRFDAPTFRHAIAAGGEAEEGRQLDDFRVAVKFLELRVDFLVSSVVERERARVVKSGSRFRIGVLPVRQRAVHFFFFGNGRGERRDLPRAEFAADDLRDLDARQLLDLVRHGAAAVEHVPIARKLLGHFGVLSHGAVPRRGRAFRDFGSLNNVAQSRIGCVIRDLRNIRHVRQSGHAAPPENLDD